MARTKISEFSATPASNTDIDSIFIGEGMAPSNVNDAIRELMAQLKDFQVGSAGDPVTVGGVLTVQAGSASTPSLTTAGDTNTGMFFPAADTIAFAEGGAEIARFDSSGNLGLGVTPSAFGSNFKALQLASGSLMSANGGSTLYALQNSFFNGTNWIYVNTAAASRAEQSGGTHTWWNAPSGTAGNAITFTQAMTLDASGNLGIGTTSPAERLDVAGNINSTGNLQFTANKYVYSSSGGSVGSVRSGAYYDGTNQVIQFLTAQTERARIDSSGNLLVGASSFQANTPRLYVTKSSQGTGSNNIIWVNDSAATASAAMHVWSFSQTTAPSSAFVDAYYNGVTTLAFRIAGNGNVTNANNSYGSTSDIKLKENIVDATPKLDKLLQVRVRNYNLKGDYEQHKQIGVIAQELETVFPSMVDETPDRDAEGNDLGTTTKSVKYSVFVPMLIKALQEQQAIIESLTTRITALEGQ
jgi:hypothetical protein